MRHGTVDARGSSSKASRTGAVRWRSAGLRGLRQQYRASSRPSGGRRVVVVGGGWGGATAAKYVRLADPTIEVVLLEPNRRFVSCPFSNLVLSGVRNIDSLTFGYSGLRDHGVKVRHEMATAIEPDTKRVRVGEGYLTYDRLIVSPGVDFQLEQVEGLAAAQRQGAPRVEGRAADGRAGATAPGDARRRRVRADGAAGRLPVPARPLRAHLPGGLVSQDEQAASPS